MHETDARRKEFARLRDLGVAGPVDYTPVNLGGQGIPRRTTDAHEVALTVVPMRLRQSDHATLIGAARCEE